MADGRSSRGYHWVDGRVQRSVACMNVSAIACNRQSSIGCSAERTSPNSHYPHPSQDFGEEEESASLVEGRWAFRVVGMFVLDRPVFREGLRWGNHPDPTSDQTSRRALLGCASWQRIACVVDLRWPARAAHEPRIRRCGKRLRQDLAAAAAAAQSCRVQEHRTRQLAGHPAALSSSR